jgi:hypothetical protein
MAQGSPMKTRMVKELIWQCGSHTYQIAVCTEY